LVVFFSTAVIGGSPSDTKKSYLPSGPNFGDKLSLLDVRGSIPTTVSASDGRTHEVNWLDQMAFEANSIYIMDRCYLPIDQHGADLFFQVISQRYERGSIILTTNKPFKQWAAIFNNDSTIASAVLDRLLHHAEIIVIEGSSYRMKDQIES
jgi:ABC-type transport system involved in cytochrome c biogenesis ATPase subunit